MSDHNSGLQGVKALDMLPDECPACGLLELVLIETTTELHGQVFTYERQECLSCGWCDDESDEEFTGDWDWD